MGGFMYISKYTDSTMITLLHVLHPLRKVWLTCSNLHTFPKIQDGVQNGRHFDQILFLKITFAFNIKTGRVWYHFKGNWIFFKMIPLWWTLWWLMAHFYPQMLFLTKFSKKQYLLKFWICSCYKIRLKCWFITFVKVALIWKNIVLKLWVQTCNNNNVI